MVVLVLVLWVMGPHVLFCSPPDRRNQLGRNLEELNDLQRADAEGLTAFDFAVQYSLKPDIIDRLASAFEVAAPAPATPALAFKPLIMVPAAAEGHQTSRKDEELHVENHCRVEVSLDMVTTAAVGFRVRVVVVVW